MHDPRAVRFQSAALLLFLLLLLPAVGAVPAAADGGGSDRPVVSTDRGQVRGRTHGAYRTFEAIPYAAAPTGALRWRLPRPAPRWEGVREAGAPGAHCVQLPALGPGGPTGSEDCLFLNVTAPAGPAGRGGQRPVMVWFHGGGFMNGAGDLYRAGGLAVRGDVVVVTVNYRLGIFGLFGHPELGGAPGFALADQQAALRWVRANAARFGGDPRAVTVFGESAGALSVCAHLTSPASAGLFHRAVVQSGSCSTSLPPRSLLPTLGAYTPFVPERHTVADGLRAADGLGCGRPAGAALDCLRALDAHALATPELMQTFSLVPYGNGRLPEEPRRALEQGRFHRVPVVQGTTADEVRLFLGQTLAVNPVRDEAAYRARLELSFGPATAREVAARYPVSAYATPAVALAAVLSDASFICPTLRDGRALARYVPTYGYRFSDADAPNFLGLPEPPDLPFGASHGFELPYLFTLVPLAGPQRELADRTTGYWTAFARTGLPRAPGAPEWPRFGRGSAPVLSLAPGAGGIRTVDAGAEHHCALWDTWWPSPAGAR
ncbi:carboxylesterase family protein [Streptomyces xanthophaeus]|uniref:carboxylesterase/lipase family protein n=1 Tax=Streptomyces xanthophaeus TaxID=67385 RepID=UPI003864985F|nr:carboxylesterase family protein [Streptomyces xanthophaeus]WST58652.1 carboxylesterase family protein [Streptomyces xanthophaeus]